MKKNKAKSVSTYSPRPQLVEVDDANITSDDDIMGCFPKHVNATSGLPKPCIAPLISTKLHEPSVSSGSQLNEFTSTNGSICQIPEFPIMSSEGRESLSPNPPVYLEFIDKSPADFSPGCTEIEDGPAQIPQYTAGVFKEAKDEDVTEMSVISVHRDIHENMISHPDLKTIILKNKENMIRLAKVGKVQSEKVVHDFKEGLLEKKSSGILGSWKPKYCRVGCNQYLIFKNVQTGLLSGIIDFSRVPATLTCDPAALTFTISIVQKAYTFRVKTQEEFAEWTKVLWFHIEKNKSNNWKALAPTVDSFWKFRMIAEKDLLKKAGTGDVLLFTGSQIGAKVQRLVTRSRFDHVALLLRCKNDSLMFIDATSNGGVGLCSWNDFISQGYYKSYSKVVYRPLQFKRTFKNQTQLEDFLKKAIGKKYKLSPLRILQKYSNQDSIAAVGLNDKGYFCSELVAVIYKLLGILPKHISSAQYWPGSFSAEEKLPLGPGAVLGDEYLVEFEKDVMRKAW